LIWFNVCNLFIEDENMAIAKKINQIVEAFELWRKNRVSRRSATPQALRQQAVELLEHCSSSKVTAMLRISGTQLKQWREAVEPSPTSSDFIRLPGQGAREPVANDHLSVELRLCNGAALTLSGDISQALLVAMLQEVRS
jgi:hypothetical protein